MCGCEFNLAAAGGAIAGDVLGNFSSRSDISAIYNSALGVFKCPHVQGKKIQFEIDDCCQFQIPCLFVFQQQFISLLLLSVTAAYTEQFKTISFNFCITLKIWAFSASSQDLSCVINRIYCIFLEFHTVINRLKEI